MPGILSIDVGGTGLKASVVSDSGAMLADRVRVPTPPDSTPESMVETLTRLVEPLPPYDRVAVGFPGVVRKGKVITAPHWKKGSWAGFDLALTLGAALGGRPVRVINDAEMQGFAAIGGHGLELVLTLGTGAGTALFQDGILLPHLELAHHPVHKDKTYNDYVGAAARDDVGNKRWSRRVGKVIEILENLLHYDHLYIGGGNAANLALDLPPTVTIVSNAAGIEGGAGVWRLQEKDFRKI